jgi:hypothetical protein
MSVGSTGREKLLVAVVSLLWRSKSRKLPHRPQLAAVAARMNASRIRKLARVAEVALIVD